MHRPARLLAATTGVLALVFATTTTAVAEPSLPVTPLGSSTSPTGEGAAEIAAFDRRTDQVLVTNGEDNRLDVISIEDPTDPVVTGSIDLAPYGGGVNSVAIRNKLVAVAVEADDAQEPGSVVLFDNDGDLVAEVTAGALPDMVTISDNGRYVVAANEGEPSGYEAGDVDPEGSVTVITMAGFTKVKDVRHATFEDFDADELRAEGVRIFGPGATAAQDLEPEYVTIDGMTAYVTLQENNALAVVDLRAAEVVDVLALGTKDHSLPGNELDPSDRDGIDGNLANWPVRGFFMPDAIASMDGYLYTANEGDAREYDGFEEEVRVKDLGDPDETDLTLDPVAFPDAAALQADEALGRLTITSTAGDTDGDGDLDELYSFGARSMSVWSAATGELVWDSGTLLTELTVAAGTWDDGRADNKGSEPEGVELGVVDDVPYAFLGLERTSDIVVFDISDPTAPTVANFVTAPDGAISPEGIEFVSADDSPTGQALLVVTYEVTGTTAVFGLG